MVDARCNGQNVAYRPFENRNRVVPLFRRRLAQERLELGTRRALPGRIVAELLEPPDQPLSRCIREAAHVVCGQSKSGAICLRPVSHASGSC
jgi:hypothetical protein